MALSPLVEKMLAQMVQQQGPMLSPLAPIGQMALTAALAAREGRSRKEDEQKVAGLAEALAAIQSPDASQFAPQGVMGSTGSQNGIAPMDVPIVTQTPEEQATGARSRLTDAYTKLAAGNPEALQQVLMRQMFPEQAKPVVIGNNAYDPTTGELRIRGEQTPPKPASSVGKILGDYESGIYGPVGSAEAMSRRDAALAADAGRGRTDVSITLPNGNSEVTSANQTEFQKQILSGRGQLQTLRTAAANFNPMFLTYRGRFNLAQLKARDLVQGIPGVESVVGGKLNNEEKDLLRQYTAWQQSSYETLNRGIKEMTGATMGVDEAARLRKQFPDPETDSPEQYVQKFNTSVRQLTLADARYSMALGEGIPISGSSDLERYMSLEDVQKKINADGEELLRQFKASGIPDEQAKQRMLQELSARYGIAL